MSNIKKLYQLKPDTFFKLDGKSYLLRNIDGMYSFCLDKDNNIHHIAAWTEVTELETMD